MARPRRLNLVGLIFIAAGVTFMVVALALGGAAFGGAAYWTLWGVGLALEAAGLFLFGRAIGQQRKRPRHET